MTDFPEAGAVINVDYKRTDGFVVKLTLRDETGAKVLERLEGAIMEITKKGGTPYEKSFGKPSKPVDYVEGKMCPTCGKRLVWAQKRDGSKFVKCETNKYINGVSTGCPFVDWMDKKSIAQTIPERQVRGDEAPQMDSEYNEYH